MPVITPNIPFIPKKRRSAATQSTPPSAPVLVSADYSLDDGAAVTLVFDRAVAIGGIDAGAFTLLHHPSEQAFAGSSAELLDAMTVKVVMDFADACELGTDVVMNAAAGNGIVAVEGGLAWAGATGLALPYP